jgi:hypothetical protein
MGLDDHDQSSSAARAGLCIVKGPRYYRRKAQTLRAAARVDILLLPAGIWLGFSILSLLNAAAETSLYAGAEGRHRRRPRPNLLRLYFIGDLLS